MYRNQPTAEQRSESAKKAAATRKARDEACENYYCTAGQTRTYEGGRWVYVTCDNCGGTGRRQKAIANPFAVGDILYGSWGYDQTNVEFYQVVAATPKMVTLREVQTMENAQPAFMTGRVWPAKDRFTNEAPIRRMVSRDGYVKLYDFGCSLKKWDGAGKYASHYA